MGGPRLSTRLSRRARTRTRWRWNRSEQVTAGLAIAAVVSAGTVLTGQFGRMLRRRTKSEEAGDGLTHTAPAAALDTVGVAKEGYAATPRSETVLLNLLGGFLGSFAFVRLSTYGIRGGWWPLGNTSVGDTHIHHFVPGIAISFAAGTAALLTDNDAL
jgi:hypothetical protein